MGAIQLQAVEKWFGETQVIKGVDLEIEDGEFVVFVGPSGCGKSTLLRIIAGLEDVSRGAIVIDGRDVSAEPPSGRGLAMVFQSYALYPHMDVRENLAFGLKTSGAPKAEIEEKVARAADILKLDVLLDRRPKALSGGQRQRVAIGRAIVREPSAFLFDEPLSNLDAALRGDMRYEIARLRQQLRTTMIYVTHDQVEAMTLADKIVVLQAGLIEQVGSPRALYDRPGNLFVAQFIGSPKMNVLPCAVTGGRVALDGADSGLTGPDGAAHLGIRPEHIQLCAPGEGQCRGVVEVSEYLGADTMVFAACGALGVVTIRQVSDQVIAPGTEVGLRFAADRLHFFGGDERRIEA